MTKNIGVCVINLQLLPPAQLHIIWKWVHPFHSEQSQKFLAEVKKFWNSKFSKAKTEECNQEDCWSVSDTSGIITPCSVLYHQEVLAPDSLNLATKASFGCQKTPTIYIFRLLLQAKMEECDRKNLFSFDKFGLLMSGLDAFFLEVIAYALLEGATKTSCRGKISENLAY